MKLRTNIGSAPARGFSFDADVTVPAAPGELCDVALRTANALARTTGAPYWDAFERAVGVASLAVPQDPDSWQTDAPGPFVTIRAGGPLDGVVTLTAIEGGHGRTLVEAFWTEGGHARSDSVEVESYEHARVIAREVADEFASGRVPDLSRD
jgi:hypothetical protein